MLMGFRYFLLIKGYKLCPGSTQCLPDNDNKFEPFRKRNLHFLHINVNSVLSKIDELRDVVRHTKPTILRITNSKLDSSGSDQKVNISDCSILRSDRNRYGGVAC